MFVLVSRSGLVATVLMAVSLSATAQLTLKNGSDIDMTGSAGSTIVFPDGTVLSTASGQGADGATGPAGADGSDANVPTGHGGTSNSVSGADSFIGGGNGNAVYDDYGTITAGRGNVVGVDDGNTTTRLYGTVGGGYTNTASDYSSTVSGGYTNIASGGYCTVSGGYTNTASGHSSTVSGGYTNIANGGYSTVSGGSNNITNGNYTTVSGGYTNTVSDYYSTVSGGRNNIASGYSSTVSGGLFNTASGSYSTVVGGGYNTAASDYSIAMGHYANVKAAHPGTFLFADNATGTALDSLGSNEFMVRATGGVRFYTDSGLTAGMYMASGSSSWSAVSARATKENFEAIDPVDILNKVAAMPVETWNYKSQDSAIRHMGPMAEDFNDAFHVGDFEGRITAMDADGVALAAIQGLNLKLEAKQQKIDELTKRLESYDAQFRSLEQRLIAMETAKQ